jgi:(1->4)-alpha-D-glucan 1-alpha-D-glucosylmutase
MLSTYRFQFNRHFAFRDAAALVPYLDALGVTDLYASPYLQANPGSLHGYDISSHGRLNPEIGTEDDHRALMAALREHSMGHVLDIVPNHMGIGQRDNEWWMDVLENGPSSVYAPYFDIDWKPLKPELAGRVLLPVLGDQFGRVLEAGDLQILYEDGRFRIAYHEHIFPVSPRSSSLILRRALDGFNASAGHEDDVTELESIVTALEHLPTRDRTDQASIAERRRENRVTRRRVRTLHDGSAGFRTALQRALGEFNGTPGDSHSYDDLERLLDDQPYRLAFWRVAAEEINYRRFFDINDLAGLRVERGEVFQDIHRLILQLVAQRHVTALRVDHPDGLYDPAGYFRDLRAECERRVDQPVPVLVEKILTGDEELPEGWPVAGDVGYSFMNRVNGLLVDGANEQAMDDIYSDFAGRSISFRELVYDRKKLILRVALASELNVLAYLLDRISEQHRGFRDFTLNALTDGLREVIACFPVYRTYIDAGIGRVSESDRDHIERAVRTAIRRNPSTSRSIYGFIRDTLLLDWPDDLSEDVRLEHARFVMKFQQLTGPVMAKGVEDTSFYIYNRLVSLNEVGGEPDRFGISPGELHAWIAARTEQWPSAMNASSTHDTKRSEDVRARINVLSEIPEEWGERVRLWGELNAAHKRIDDGEPMPDRNDEYLLYQTLVGAWPLEQLGPEEYSGFVGRIQQYMEKATREAKVHTSWINPNEGYDDALRTFIADVLGTDPKAENPFIADFLPFQKRVAGIGMLNALSQTLLKLTMPGVADIYQGQEMWDFSLVDPDNRRPVDYGLRERRLEALDARLIDDGNRCVIAAELLDEWRDGRVKMHLTRAALHLRRSRPELFVGGEYVPLEARGPKADHLFAFALRRGDAAAIVIVPRLWFGLMDNDRDVPDSTVWAGTELAGPAWLAGRYHRELGGGMIEVDATRKDAVLPAELALQGFPVELLSVSLP